MKNCPAFERGVKTVIRGVRRLFTVYMCMRDRRGDVTAELTLLGVKVTITTFSMVAKGEPRDFRAKNVCRTIFGQCAFLSTWNSPSCEKVNADLHWNLKYQNL